MIPVKLNGQKAYFNEYKIERIEKIDDKDLVIFKNGKEIICEVLIDEIEARKKIALAKTRSKPRMAVKKWQFQGWS